MTYDGVALTVFRVERTDTGHGPRIQVTFRVSTGEYAFEFPVQVNPAEIDEGDLIRVARTYLHRFTAALAEKTAGWNLSDQELQSLRPF